MPGRTYRNETLDARHSPVFHQIEGLAVDHGITFGDLAGTLEAFTQRVLRRRALKSRFCSRLLPVHRAVGRVRGQLRLLRRRGLPGLLEDRDGSSSAAAAWSTRTCSSRSASTPRSTPGFAFGFGLERMPMLRYGVEPIKTFFDNDIRFLTQY